MENERLKILVAEDSDSDRLILQTIVRRLGHDVVTAADGQQALACFRRERPQIVLLDALMPRMDGREAARRIKALAGEALVPIIFLTSLSDAEELAGCLEAGGDDFLPKPYNRTIIEAKINAFNRMRMMHATVQEQRDIIRARNDQLLREQQMARRVFDNVAHSGCLDAANIRYLLSPLSIFNGDVLFACPKPSGGMHVFLGDFTGHGLPAAIGAMPVAEIFYSMTSKGFSIANILREINQKLKNILPTGMFCCALMVDVNPQLREIEVWNGGLPEGYILRNDNTHTVIESRHLPLGVLPEQRFSAVCERFKVSIGERLLFCSDGILEATDEQGKMFGRSRLEAVLRGKRPPEGVFDALLDAIQAFTGTRLHQDDVTLVELTMVPEKQLTEVNPSVSASAQVGPAQWRCDYELSGPTLAHFNPLPLLLHICMEVPGLRPFSGHVYTVLSEMFSNALEHGILRLSSDLKRDAKGFSEYYAERARRLADPGDAWVRFSLRHVPADGGGRLTIACEDSGKGFDYTRVMAGEPSGSTPAYAGRGIALIRQLCTTVRFAGSGNRIAAEFDWSAGHSGAIDEDDDERHPTSGP